MTLFLLLLKNLVPLYILIAAGFVGGKYLRLDRHTLAGMAVYMFTPVVVFGFISDLKLKPEYAALPVIAYAISAIVGFGFLWIGRRIYPDNRANLLAMLASMGNTGYFGLPVALLLFDKNHVGIYMFMLLGITGFEATIGYYIASRGKFDVRASLLKLATFPSIYAMTAGLLVNVSGIHLPDLFYTYWTYFKGAYVITGMMLIGTALSAIRDFRPAPLFLLLSFAGKFLAWPLVTLLFVQVDAQWLHLFMPDIYRLLYLLALVPFAANIAAYSAQMDMRPEKAATTILLGTIFALFYIPLVMGMVGS